MTNELALEIESLDLEGRGIAHRDGKVIFVAGALAGERVRARPVRVKPSYETAEVTEVLRSSPLRVTPRCPHFGLAPGSCGGCAMQHLDPAAQVAIKQRALEDTLWHIGKLRAETVLRPVHGPNWHYRYRARMAVRDVPKKGGVLVGFHERGKSFVADMTECHVLPPEVCSLLPALRTMIGALSVRRRLPQIELAVADEDGRRRIIMVLRVLEPLTDADRRTLLDFGQRHLIEFWAQPGGPHTAAPLQPGADAESPLTLSLPEFGVAMGFGPTDFTQVNHRINEVLVRRALRLLRVQPQEMVADFFCGLGNFTLPLATQAAHVVGLEGSAPLLERARAAAAAHGLAARTSFVARNLFEFTADDWRGLTAAAPIDAVLVDPPREGAHALAQTLAATPVPPSRLVYVSCNPATLARDCAVLVHEGGWRMRSAGVVNMFPHTTHVESMALLLPPRPARAQR